MFLLFSGIIVITCFFIVDAAGGWFSAVESLAVYEAKPGIIAWHGRIGPDVTGRQSGKRSFGRASSVWPGASLWR